MEYGNPWVKLRVSGSGAVEYDGERYVVVEGKHQRHIAPEDVRELLDAFRRADFFSLRDDYTVVISDGPGVTTTSIQIGGLKKIVLENGGKIPSALKDVRNAILKFSHSDQWVIGNADTISDLLAETSDPATQRAVLSDILPRAAIYSNTAVIRALLTHPIDLEHLGPYRATALLHAAQRGLPDMVAALLDAGANPRAVDDVRRGAMIFGAGSGNAQVMRLLLATGLKGDEADRYGDTALMAAAASGNPESVRLLLSKGARVNARNCRRQTALLSAADGDPGFCYGDSGRENPEVPEEVIQRDVVVRILLDAGADINARNWYGETALFSLEDEAVQELIRHRINLETRDPNGETALVSTVAASIAAILISAGANVNSQDDKGETALMKAAERHYVDKLDVLVKAPGIRLELRDKKGETALMKARAARFEDCISILVSAGATQ